jgi:hypothetical protein
MTLAAILLVVLIALLIIDCLQTRYIFAHGRGELNPVIRWAYARWGRRGIDGYFACWIAAVLLFSAFVPWPLVGAGGAGIVALIEAAVVVRNYRRGVRT